jgi:hypothetical protein
MVPLQTILDRIRQHGWQLCEVLAAIRVFGLPPLDSWHESEWFMLELVM